MAFIIPATVYKSTTFQTKFITTDSSLITIGYRSQWNHVWSHWPLITFYHIKFKARLTDACVRRNVPDITSGDGVDDSVEHLSVAVSDLIKLFSTSPLHGSCVSFVAVTRRLFSLQCLHHNTALTRCSNTLTRRWMLFLPDSPPPHTIQHVPNVIHHNWQLTRLNCNTTVF